MKNKRKSPVPSGSQQPGPSLTSTPDNSSGIPRSTPEPLPRSIFQISEQDVEKVNETLTTMDTWFPTRIYNIFHGATTVKDVIALLKNRRVHPDDLTTLMILAERKKMMTSALIFIIIDFEKNKSKNN